MVSTKNLGERLSSPATQPREPAFFLVVGSSVNLSQILFVSFYFFKEVTVEHCWPGGQTTDGNTFSREIELEDFFSTFCEDFWLSYRSPTSKSDFGCSR